MERRKIGSLEVSVVGLGGNNFGNRVDLDGTRAVVDASLDAGINFIDTADTYGDSEDLLGEVLAGRRDDVVIATKFGSKMPDGGMGAAPDYVRSAAERSLRRLQVDCIDLYQLHRPDPETPIGDTLVALDELVQAGKVREIGCSNFTAEQIREAEDAVRGGAARFVTVQNYYNLLRRDDEADVLPLSEQLGLGYLPYFPLASGMLTGKYRRGEEPPEGTRIAGNQRFRDMFLSDEMFDKVEPLTAWAESRGHSLLELAVAWLAAKPAVASVIAGATKPEQVHANAAAGSWVLSPDEVAEVDGLAS